MFSPPSHQLARGNSQSVGEKLHDRDDCAVRCQGGSLGLSCCHGSAVTVYGHSYCCEECNNLKSPKRHLKHGTPSLQSQVVYDSDPDKVDKCTDPSCSLNSKHLDTYSEPGQYDIRKPARRNGQWIRNPHSKIQRRQSRPLRGSEAGLPWPDMVSRTRAVDGSIMMVLDSGAEASVFKDLDLIPLPLDLPLSIVSFNGSSSCCNQSGECISAVKDVRGGDMYLSLGYAGFRPEAVKDNLVSIPTLLRLGYQFWLGDYPYMLTPLGEEIPLYVDSSGYLGLRVHSTADAKFLTLDR